MNAVYRSDIKSFVLNEDCFINRVSTNTECETHFHEYIEFVYSFGGKSIQYVDGERYLTERGDLLLINCGSAHSIYPKPHAEYADIMFKPEFIDESKRGERDVFSLLSLDLFSEFSDLAVKEVVCVHFSGKERDYIENLLKLTLSEEKRLEPGFLLVLRSVVVMLVCFFLRKSSSEKKEAETEKFHIDRDLLEYITANCHRPLRASDAARLCFYSPEHFSRSFKEYAGVSFTEFLRGVRIERAAFLLRETDQSVEQIFNRCGFSNRTAFFKSFAEKMNTTPMQYRRISKKGTF